MIFGQNLISILMSKPDKQAIMQMSFFGADPLPKTPDHQKKFVAHQNSNFFILSYALMFNAVHYATRQCYILLVTSVTSQNVSVTSVLHK